MKINEKYLDVPNDKPSFPIPLNWVTIFHQQEYIKIREIFGKTNIKCILCNLEIGISLSEKFRGIHMSRVENDLMNSLSTTYNSLDDFTQTLAKNVFDSQYCRAVKVKAEGSYNYTITTPKSILKSQQPFNILSSSVYNGKRIKKMIGIENNILMACPCIQRHFSTILGKNNRQNNDDESLSKLITHTQKGKVHLFVENSDDLLNYKNLLSVIKRSTILTSELLKRPDERHIVLKALNDACFVEDLVRRIANNLYMHLIDKKSTKKRDIFIKVTSYESIHSHDISAELEINTDELQKFIGERL